MKSKTTHVCDEKENRKTKTNTLTNLGTIRMRGAKVALGESERAPLPALGVAVLRPLLRHNAERATQRRQSNRIGAKQRFDCRH
jgi:hypothetical protein